MLKTGGKTAISRESQLTIESLFSPIFSAEAARAVPATGSGPQPDLISEARGH
jgi:hypothetical protein